MRTTISFHEDIYRGVTARYRELGFTRIGDLVNEAVRGYLHRRRIDEKHRSMARAAADPDYRRLLREAPDDFREIDADGVPEY